MMNDDIQRFLCSNQVVLRFEKGRLLYEKYIEGFEHKVSPSFKLNQRSSVQTDYDNYVTKTISCDNISLSLKMNSVNNQ